VQQSLFQLLALHRIEQPHPSKVLGRKVGNPHELERLFVAHRVADLDRAVVVNPDYVARIRFLDPRAILRHKNRRILDLHIFADAVVPHFHPARELPRADAQKGNPIAVLRVHVRLDLEHHSRKRRLVRGHRSRRRRSRPGRRRKQEQRIEQLRNPKVVHRATEKHRRQLARQVRILIKRSPRALQKL